MPLCLDSIMNKRDNAVLAWILQTGTGECDF